MQKPLRPHRSMLLSRLVRTSCAIGPSCEYFDQYFGPRELIHTRLPGAIDASPWFFLFVYLAARPAEAIVNSNSDKWNILMMNIPAQIGPLLTRDLFRNRGSDLPFRDLMKLAPRSPNINSIDAKTDVCCGCLRKNHLRTLGAQPHASKF